MSTLREAVKRVFPPVMHLAARYRRLRRWLRAFRLRRKSRAEVFTEYFETNQWADADSRSGQGSNLQETRVARAALPEIIAAYGIRSMVDIPCGDFFWMRQVDLGGVCYVGCDIVAPMIERHRREFASPTRSFMVVDLCVDPPPAADLVFCRDALVHLSNAEVLAALANIRRSGAGYLLTTTFPDVSENADIVTGMWRPINLTRPPFGLSAPLRLINEGYQGQHRRYGDKSLGLWRVADLPPAGDADAAA